MSRKIAFMFTHGIGTQTESQFRSRVMKLTQPFIKSFMGTFKKDFQNYEHNEENINFFTEPLQFDFISLHWDFADYNQAGLSYIQRYVRNSLMDPFSYQSNKNYEEVNKEIDELFLQLKFDDYDHVVLIGHSWGGVVFSNFVWDCLNESSSGREIYEPSLKAQEYCAQGKVTLVTLMSPTYLQSLKYGEDAQPPNLPGGILNLHARHDPFSFPLTTKNYQVENFKNIEIKTGPFLGRTPFCHIRCFTPYIMKQVASHISSNITANHFKTKE